MKTRNIASSSPVLVRCFDGVETFRADANPPSAWLNQASGSFWRLSLLWEVYKTKVSEKLWILRTDLSSNYYSSHLKTRCPTRKGLSPNHLLGGVVCLIQRHVEAYFLLSPEPSTCTNKKWQHSLNRHGHASTDVNMCVCARSTFSLNHRSKL